MFDRWEARIEADTAEKDADLVVCKISPGILTDLIVYMPAGCQYLARCRVKIGQRPLWPRSPGKSIALEDMPLSLSGLAEPIKGELPELNWEVWNLDDTNPHTIWLGAQWLTEEEQYQKRTLLAIEELLSIFKGEYK